MSRVLLLLPSSTYRAADFLDAARTLAIEIVVASEPNQALADQLGDSFIPADFSDVETSTKEIVERLTGRSVDAVVPVDDQSVVLAARVADRLRLPHNPPEAVAVTRDKARLRRTLQEAAIPQAAFAVAADVADAVRQAEQLGFPVVLKPVGLSASRGVIRADDPVAAESAAGRIANMLAEEGADGPILVETYLSGHEVAVEGVLTDGRLMVLAVFDKPDPLEGPYFEETIFITPSRLPAPLQESVVELTAATIDAIGLREGPVHAELRVDGGRPAMLEVAARSIGGLCGRALRFGLMGSSLEELLLRHAVSLPVIGMGRERRAAGVMMLPIPTAGRLMGVEHQDEALRVPGVTDLQVTVAPGRFVRPLPEGDRYLGFLFARGDTPEAVEKALREGYRRLAVVIEPA